MKLKILHKRINEDLDIKFEYPEKDDFEQGEYYTNRELRNLKVMYNKNFEKIIINKLKQFPGPNIITIVAPISLGQDENLLKYLINKRQTSEQELKSSIIYVQDGFNDHIMTPWIFVHNLGHALFDKDNYLTNTAYNILNNNQHEHENNFLLDNMVSRNVLNDNEFNTLIKIFDFKSARATKKAMSGEKISYTEVIADWKEFILELFSTFMLNKHIKHNDKNYSNIIKNLEEFFLKILFDNIGKIIRSGS